MKRIKVWAAIAAIASLGLSACGSDDLDEITPAMGDVPSIESTQTGGSDDPLPQ